MNMNAMPCKRKFVLFHGTSVAIDTCSSRFFLLPRICIQIQYSLIFGLGGWFHLSIWFVAWVDPNSFFGTWGGGMGWTMFASSSVPGDVLEGGDQRLRERRLAGGGAHDRRWKEASRDGYWQRVEERSRVAAIGKERTLHKQRRAKGSSWAAVGGYPLESLEFTPLLVYRILNFLCALYLRWMAE